MASGSPGFPPCRQVSELDLQPIMLTRKPRNNQRKVWLDAGHCPTTSRCCAGDGVKRTDPTWSAVSSSSGCLSADGLGSRLPLPSVPALAPSSFAARRARIGARIGSGSSDLMPVGGPARPHCLLTVSGSEQAAACSPAGITLAICFCSLHLFSPARSLARQRWGRITSPAAHRPWLPQGHIAANTTSGSPMGSETPTE